MNNNNEFVQPIEIELLERCMDIEMIRTSNKFRNQKWLEKRGYQAVQTAQKEKRLRTSNGCLDIVMRQLNTGICTMMEPMVLSPENCSLDELKLTLGSAVSEYKQILPVWKDFRRKQASQVSICTRLMPVIVGGILKDYYHVEDERILMEISHKLMPFGSRYFGKKEFDIPENPILWDYETPYYVCYAPGELEAIAEVCSEILKTVNTLEELQKFDMKRFKEMLRVKAEKIPVTLDIGMFGRHIHGSGLREMDSAIEVSCPIRVTA